MTFLVRQVEKERKIKQNNHRLQVCCYFVSLFFLSILLLLYATTFKSYWVLIATTWIRVCVCMCVCDCCESLFQLLCQLYFRMQGRIKKENEMQMYHHCNSYLPQGRPLQPVKNCSFVTFVFIFLYTGKSHFYRRIFCNGAHLILVYMLLLMILWPLSLSLSLFVCVKMRKKCKQAKNNPS